MALTHCPHCGEPLAVQAKRSTAIEPLNVNTLDLSTTAMYAYYKRTSARADVAFLTKLFPDLAPLLPHPSIRSDCEITFQRSREYLNERERAQGRNAYANDWLIADIPEPWQGIARDGGFTRLTMHERRAA